MDGRAQHLDENAEIVVSVTLGGLECLRMDGAEFRVLVTPLADQTRIAEALARAITVFLASQPPLSPIASAADAVEKLAAMADPVTAAAGIAEIAEAITDFRVRIDADARHRIAH